MLVFFAAVVFVKNEIGKECFKMRPFHFVHAVVTFFNTLNDCFMCFRFSLLLPIEVMLKLLRMALCCKSKSFLQSHYFFSCKTRKQIQAPVVVL